MVDQNKNSSINLNKETEKKIEENDDLFGGNIDIFENGNLEPVEIGAQISDIRNNLEGLNSDSMENNLGNDDFFYKDEDKENEKNNEVFENVYDEGYNEDEAEIVENVDDVFDGGDDVQTIPEIDSNDIKIDGFYEDEVKELNTGEKQNNPEQNFDNDIFSGDTFEIVDQKGEPEEEIIEKEGIETNDFEGLGDFDDELGENEQKSPEEKQNIIESEEEEVPEKEGIEINDFEGLGDFDDELGENEQKSPEEKQNITKSEEKEVSEKEEIGGEGKKEPEEEIPEIEEIGGDEEQEKEVPEIEEIEGEGKEEQEEEIPEIEEIGGDEEQEEEIPEIEEIGGDEKENIKEGNDGLEIDDDFDNDLDDEESEVVLENGQNTSENLEVISNNSNEELKVDESDETDDEFIQQNTVIEEKEEGKIKDETFEDEEISENPIVENLEQDVKTGDDYECYDPDKNKTDIQKKFFELERKVEKIHEFVGKSQDVGFDLLGGNDDRIKIIYKIYGGDGSVDVDKTELNKEDNSEISNTLSFEFDGESVQVYVNNVLLYDEIQDLQTDQNKKMQVMEKINKFVFLLDEEYKKVKKYKKEKEERNAIKGVFRNF